MPIPGDPDCSGFSLSAPPEGFIDDPYPFYDRLRSHSPVHRLGPNSVLLTRHADVLAVYRSPLVSSDKQREFEQRLAAPSPIFEHHTTSLVFSDPPLHTRVRRILMGALNQKVIFRMQAGVEALVQHLLDTLADHPRPDLIENFAAHIPVAVIGDLLNMPINERGPLSAWSLDILSALEPAPAPEVLARANTAVTDFTAALRELVAHRKRYPGDVETDVLTRLLQGDAEGQLSEAELLHNCIFLLNAGHETTTKLIGNGMQALLHHRDQFDRLVADAALLPTAIEELLRFESPLQLNNRLSTAPVQVGGVNLPAGTFMTLGVGAANRDPAAFDRPEQLDLGRRPNQHLAFGQGAHACSGMNVARLEARIAIGGLVARYPKLVASGLPVRDRRVRFRGLRQLPVQLC